MRGFEAAPAWVQGRRGRAALRALLLAACAGAIAIGAATGAGMRRELLAPAPSRLLLDRASRHLGELPGEDGELGYWPPPYVLPEKIVVATLETEDRYFHLHRGVRPQSVLRAAWQNLTSGRVVSGASTLAMQVARMQSPGPRSLGRKAREAVEALLLIRDHGHERVLRQYLTLAPYGNNVRGASRAARFYFDKPLEDLSWLQAAFLAGLPQAPGRMNPHDEEGQARGLRRARRILRTLRERGVIDGEALRQALASELRIVPRPQRDPAALHAVLAWGERFPAGEVIARATLDLGMQRTAGRIVRENVEALAAAGAGTSAALVVELESCEVLAHVGSHDYFDEEERGGIDYARVKRSPGSALKPFIYALGLERGQLTAASELPDLPLDLSAGDGRSYQPENYNHRFHGPMLLREALANSRNIPALETLSAVGVEPVLELVRRGGVTGLAWDPGHYGLGLAIGTLPVTVEELAGLYSGLARGGEACSLRRFAGEPQVAGARLVGPEAAALITDILADPTARRPSFAAGGPLDFDYAVAAKTGTSQGHRDAWAVGYSDRLLVVVWVGAHDVRRMHKLTGARAAGGAMHRILDALMPQVAPHREIAATFRLPERHARVGVCPLSGRRAGPDCPHVKEEVFIAGTEPWEQCSFHAQVAIDRRNGLRAGADCPARFVETRAMLDLPERYAPWARAERLPVAPLRFSPACPGRPREGAPSVVIREPRGGSEYLWDPDTPAESAAIRLAAAVHPPEEEIVWVVDGRPVARVGYPHEARWSLSPGAHVIEARMARRSDASVPVRVVVRE